MLFVTILGRIFYATRHDVKSLLAWYKFNHYKEKTKIKDKGFRKI
jgi:hypothetical protein